MKTSNMISVQMMNALQSFDDNDKKAKSLLKLSKKINIENFKNVCIVGFNSIPYIPKNTNITIIEPTYYDFFENIDRLTYINKFCWKDNKTHFNLIQCEDPDANFGEQTDGEPNTITIDEVGDFDIIIDLPIKAYLETLLGAKRNINKNHPIIAHSLFSYKYKEIYDFLRENGYLRSYFASYNDNILICYEYSN